MQYSTYKYTIQMLRASRSQELGKKKIVWHPQSNIFMNLKERSREFL